MKLNHSRFEIRNSKFTRGFTMVEIALSLAIIAFALVAIIGILPIGMSVQKDNRAQTMINLDAAFLMDAIRGGAQGQEDLVNYVTNIAIVSTTYDATNGVVAGPVTNIYNLANLTKGKLIVGLLTTPKYLAQPSVPGGHIGNTVTAYCRALNGPAVDQGPSDTSRDFAFQYQVTVEVVPSAEYAFTPTSTNWLNFASPGVIPPAVTGFTNGAPPSGAERLASNLQPNLNEIRLSFRWPLLPGSNPPGTVKLGLGHQVFRTSAAGTMGTQVGGGTTYYFIQPLAYQPGP